MWPSRAARRRVYLHVSRYGKLPALFGKLAFGEPDSGCLRNERRALEALAAVGLPFELPRVLHAQGAAGAELVLFERQSFAASPAVGSPDPWVAAFRGTPRVVPFDDVARLPWWQAFCAGSVGQSPFADVVRQRATGGMRVATVHGDLAPGNVRRLPSGRVCVFDWESYDPSGPAETDRVHYWVGSRQARVLRNPRRSRISLLGCAAQQGISVSDTLFALAFLVAHGNMAATALAEAWLQDPQTR